MRVRRTGSALALALTLAALAYAWLYGVRLAPDVARGTGDFAAAYLPAGAEVLSGRSPNTVPGWLYPPLLAFLVAPLAALPYAVAAWLWFLLAHLGLAFAAAWTWRGIGHDGTAAAAVALAWAGSGAIAPSLREGQVNAVLLALVCVTLWPPARARWLAPACLGAAVALKLWPGILWLGQLGRGRRRELAASLASAGVLVAGPVLAIAVALDGPLWSRSPGAWAGTPAFLNGSLPGVALRALDPPTPGEPLPVHWVRGNLLEELRLPDAHRATALAVSAATLAVGLVLLAARVRRARDAATRPRVGAALISLALVAAPVCWPHYHVLQLPGAALLAAGWWRERRRAWLVALALALLAVGWTEAIVMGPYLRTHGIVAGSPALAWILSTTPALGAAALFALHLAGLRAGERAVAGSGASVP